MKSILLILSLSFVFTNCTMYKSGQTPDDVYFSPAASQPEYVQAATKNDKLYNGSQHEYNPYASINNGLEDESYAYNPYYYQFSNNLLYYNNPYFNNTWGNYSYWNYNYYNPSNTHIVIVQPATAVYNRPRMFNLNAYVPPNNSVRGNRVITSSTTSQGATGNYRGSNTNAGNFLRNVFGTGNSSPAINNNTSNSTSRSTNTSTPSSGGSSRSSSSGSSAPVRHF